MKSPWQLIKNLTSRRKPKDAGEGVDVVSSTDDPGGQDVAQADKALVSPAETSPPIEPVSSPEIAADEPNPLLRPDSPPLEPIPDEVPRADEQSSAAPIVQASAPETSVSAVEAEQEERQANAGQAQKHVSKHAIVRKARRRPETKKTALEEKNELDREINELRSQLSAKLHEQNRQLRGMLERYDET